MIKELQILPITLLEAYLKEVPKGLRAAFKQHQIYYDNLRILGLEYPTLGYGQALPFLLLLPHSIFDGSSIE